MKVGPPKALARRRGRSVLLAVVATLTLAGSQALLPAPAGAQAAKDKAVRTLGALPSEAPKRALPELVPVASTAAVPTRTDVPPHPDDQGDRHRPAAAGAGHDPARSTTIDAETTPTKRVTANPDGSRTLFESASPVRFKDPAGAWRDIDTALVAAADGSLSAKSSPVAARLGAGATGDIATLDTSAGPIVLRHPEASPAKATVRAVGPKSDALYAGGLPGGRDVVMALTGSGIKENVVLADAKSPPTYIDELVLPPGMTARAAAADIELRDAKGELVATFAGGLAHDASFPGAGPAAATPVTLKLLERSPSATSPANIVSVEVGIDTAWLAGPRQFPVTIDPSIFYAHATPAEAGKDTFVANQGWTNTDFSDWPTLYTGTNDAGVTTFRTLLSFSTAGLPTGDVQVLNANVWLYNSWTASCTPRQVQIAGLSSPLVAGTTWANKPGVSATPQPGAPLRPWGHRLPGRLRPF